jgi:hypothetical protein
MMINKLRTTVFAAALTAASGLAVVGPGSVVSAHCVGSSTVASSTGSGREYNLNANTCDGDLQYTGRFEDLSTTVSIRMRWDANQDGGYEGISGNSSSNVANTISGLLWTYTDSNSASWFQICHTNGSGGIIACGSRGTNSGY